MSVLLNVEGIRKYFGPEPVLNGAGFEIRTGQHVALVGPNGAGKTTLFRILTGEVEPDAGTVKYQQGARWGVLEQHPKFDHETLWDEAFSALASLVELQKEAEQLAKALGEADESNYVVLSSRLDRLHQELEHHDAYHLDHRVEKVLEGLQFSRETFRQPVTTLSGGQQNRLLLAKLLLESPDLMLLDEPSNHLDVEATIWLEDFLRKSPSAILLISHDRYLLDSIADRTLELFQGSIDSYPGNYTKYLTLKAERVEIERKTFERQKAEIEKLEDFVRKHHHGQKHAQAEDRKKKLERIELVDPPREIIAPPMGFPAASRTGDIVLRVERIQKGFGDQPLFENLTFDLLRGEKWGILGPNGSGKTTLLKCLLGQLPCDEGQVSLGQGVKIGYFDQQLQCVADDCDAEEAVRPDHKATIEVERRNLLARFGITGDMAFQSVGQLSGGERNRVALARLAGSDANFLILDEPTNHLDLWARQALEKAVTNFNGTVLFVSHDRYFINEVADHLIVVGGEGRFQVIEGNYETFKNLESAGLAQEATRDKVGKSSSSAKETKRDTHAKPAKKKRKFPYRKVEDLEADIASCEANIASCHEKLASPEVLRDGDRVKQTAADLEAEQARLASLYEHWDEAMELN
jgi:ATP-binding cassette subfamily F protein 3